MLTARARVPACLGPGESGDDDSGDSEEDTGGELSDSTDAEDEEGDLDEGSGENTAAGVAT